MDAVMAGKRGELDMPILQIELEVV